MKHGRRFTVVGNHLAQHAQMSLVAIGLALHVQSLPTGALIGIKDLAARFPESEYRIARALRELEEYGYLRRTRERLPSGQVVTRTVSYNRPGCTAPDPEPDAKPPPAAGPEPKAPTQLSPLPRPSGGDSAPRRAAAEGILQGLRGVDARLLLGARDIERLAPAVEAWLERGAGPDAVTAALTANMPARPRSPAGLIAHRLTEQIPPEGVRGPGGVAGAQAPLPLRNCEGCDRAYRGAGPEYCDGCTTAQGTTPRH
ncbi:helix-turn-helix domain-containing protein [Streptomyces sp. G-G2]|uniref:helix-turn-helix domain-containing protein n=1 Tax=Streptomyces sp. G-G2 TaxID=3046201 RepID=UPI0024BBAE18|nr:helix-turn-helix domain-containing protein [Streptomyces sp. G-G2]MDJ0383481.1 helix-turn-helix domain-containing protein [Streptomyces sp. G-G2]